MLRKCGILLLLAIVVRAVTSRRRRPTFETRSLPASKRGDPSRQGKGSPKPLLPGRSLPGTPPTVKYI